MAMLTKDPEREARAARRSCGECPLCCTILRVDELAKRAGDDCVHQRRPDPGAVATAAGTALLGGCGIYETRPPICRGYRCLWLQGGLEDDERPDRTGGIVDLETTGVGLRLAIRESRRGAFDASPALQSIAARYREQMPVRISDAEDVMNPDRPFRVLLAGGVEHRVEGESVEVRREGRLVERRRLPWAERWARRLANGWRARQLARWSARGRELDGR
jgi:Fe-S-cluster containining protein